MIHKYGLLVSVSDDKKINLIVYEKGEIIKTLSQKETLKCLLVVEEYGKLLVGTKERAIIELDLSEILNSVGFKHDYTKYPFMKDSSNFKLKEAQEKKINNVKVMNLIVKDLFEN